MADHGMKPMATKTMTRSNTAPERYSLEKVKSEYILSQLYPSNDRFFPFYTNNIYSIHFSAPILPQREEASERPFNTDCYWSIENADRTAAAIEEYDGRF